MQFRPGIEETIVCSLLCCMMIRINRNLFWSAKKDDAGDYTLGLHKVFNPEDRQPDLHTGIQDQAQIQANVHQCIRMVSDLICGQEERKERSINGECNNVNHRYINNTFETFLKRFPRHWGAASVRMPRIMDAAYPDGIGNVIKADM